MPDLAPRVGQTDFNGIDEHGFALASVYWRPKIGDRLVLTDENISVWATVREVKSIPEPYRYMKDGVPGAGQGEHDRWLIHCKPDWDTKSE